MDYVQMTLDDWMSLKKQIKEEFIKASSSFVRIGYLLRKAEDSQGYRNEGYESLAEWAHDELGLTATYVSRFKAINAKYSADGYSDHLMPEFVGYGSAKLGEMLALPDADMEMLTPEMKRSDIRALKEFNREEPEAPDQESWILEMMEIIPDGVKEDLAKECLQGDIGGKKCADILNPSGNSMKRTRAAMIAMTDEGLFVKTFGPAGGRRKISWQDFAEMLMDRFEKWKPAQKAPEEKPAEPVQAEVPDRKENAQPAAENAGSAPESAQIELENAQYAPEVEQQEPDHTGEAAEMVKEEPEEAEAGGQDAETAEGASQEPEQIMPEPVEKEPIAPAQKPAESETYRDAKSMLKGIGEAFQKKDWDRVLRLIEGLEPAIRKLKKEKG